MKFVLLDDDRNFNVLFSKMIAEDGANEVEAFSTEEEFVTYLRNNHTEIAAVFMDIELKNSNGIELASAVNRMYEKMPIIFITGYPEKYCQDVFLKDFSFTPFAFITKPVTESSISKVLQKILICGKRSGLIVVKKGKSNTIVELDKLMYIESLNKELVFHTVDDKIIVHEKLTDYLDKLTQEFLVPHKSYAVNIRYVKNYTGKDVTLVDDSVIPISRSRKADFIDKLIYLRGFCYGS